MKKGILILLALWMALSCCACAENTEEEDGTLGVESALPGAETATEGVTEEPDPHHKDFRVERNNYGKTFGILYCQDTLDGSVYFEKSENAMATRVLEASAERIKATEAYLGVNVDALGLEHSYQFTNYLQTMVRSGGKSYHMLIIPTAVALEPMMGYLVDMNTLEGINTSAGYWGEENNQRLQIKGTQIFGYNRFLLPDDAHVVAFNRDIVKGEFSADTLYDLVENHEWTLEALQSYSAEYGKDNGDGVLDYQDRYGLAFVFDTLDIFNESKQRRAPIASFQTSSDIQIMDNANHTLNILLDENHTRFFSLAEKLSALAAADTTYFNYPNEVEQAWVRMDSDRIMFELTSLRELTMHVGDSQDVGVLPYPLFDQNQENYRTLYVGGLIALAKGNEDLDMAADVVETLAYYSHDVQEAYSLAVWEKINSSSARDVTMLRQIRYSMTVDLGWSLLNDFNYMGGVSSAIGKSVSKDGPTVEFSLMLHREQLENAIQRAMAKYLVD
ncbi:MAG: hypothetical protein E7610_06585 [Ruminococcaceae bacterium]|nr:hypothetical protein [Oscillospiraceae bacterium]